MCTVSNIGDNWTGTMSNRWPKLNVGEISTWTSLVTRDEFEALKMEMQELKKLLKAAKKFDEATGQPDCQMEDKVKLIRDVAKMVGVDMGDVLPSQ